MKASACRNSLMGEHPQPTYLFLHPKHGHDSNKMRPQAPPKACDEAPSVLRSVSTAAVTR